jgi:2,3-bisphosphoglycerate-independent phosphoglycerate mutase
MSVLGCNLETEYCGRGPLEAAGNNVPLKPDDIAFRTNLVTVENGILKDYSGAQVKQEHAMELIAALNSHFGGKDVRFHAGVSYRTLLVLSGPRFSHKVNTEKPDDNHGEHVSDHLPSAACQEAEFTADFLRKLIAEAPSALKNCPSNRKLASENKATANGIWPWSGGKAGALRKLKDKYGITGAVISAVPVIEGIARCLGMDVIKVPGATGYVNTNYEGKADAAI